MNSEWNFNLFDNSIYISDIETHALLYMSEACRAAVGIEGDAYQGRKCYTVLQGLEAPCDFCTNSLLHQDSVYTWEYTNTHLKRHYLLKDRRRSLKCGMNGHVNKPVEIKELCRILHKLIHTRPKASPR